MEEKCIVTKYWSHPVPCCDTGIATLEFHNGELIAVTRCAFCGKIIQSRMIPTAPCLIEDDKIAKVNSFKEKKQKQKQEETTEDTVDWKWKLP